MPDCAASVMAMTGLSAIGRITEIPAAKTISDLCPNCNASDSREVAQKKAIAFARGGPMDNRKSWIEWFKPPFWPVLE